MRTSGVSDTLCMLIAGKWLLCLVQCIVMSVHGVLAMCLAALLCWLMQGHGTQMQQLRYNTWQACLGQMTLNIKYSGATADTGICCYASLSLALQAGPALLDVLRLFCFDNKFSCILCTIFLSSCSWTCICCTRNFFSDACSSSSDPHSVGFVKYRSDQWEMINSTSLNHPAHASI